MTPSTRSLLVPAAFALAACSTAPELAPGPTVRGALELRVRNTWDSAAITHAISQSPGVPSGLDAPLRLTQLFRPPPYRDSEVSIRFAVNREGRVVDARILKVAGGLGQDRMFVNTLNAVRLWRFEPPMLAGKAVNYCCIDLTIENVAP